MAKSATAKEKKHLEKVASFGCIACVNSGLGETPAEIHHIGNGTMGKRASNQEVIPLCHVHHRTGGHGVAVHAGRETWESNFGTEQELLEQMNLWLSL
tara:strand:+ start:9965 stop:10258 length:294 start_codon:yes stop_codon:yes gene_type:complete